MNNRDNITWWAASATSYSATSLAILGTLIALVDHTGRSVAGGKEE